MDRQQADLQSEEESGHLQTKEKCCSIGQYNNNGHDDTKIPVFLKTSPFFSALNAGLVPGICWQTVKTSSTLHCFYSTGMCVCWCVCVMKRMGDRHWLNLLATGFLHCVCDKRNGQAG